jgi:hypothetical protein
MDAVARDAGLAGTLAVPCGCRKLFAVGVQVPHPCRACGADCGAVLEACGSGMLDSGRLNRASAGSLRALSEQSDKVREAYRRRRCKS